MNENSAEPEVLVGTDEAAKLLQITPQRIRQLIAAGTLSADRVGSTWVIKRSDVEKSRSKIGSSTIEPIVRSTTHSGLTALSFFSGSMGLDLGLEEAGIHTALACEFDNHARKTITRNRPDIPVLGDIWKYSSQDVRALAGLGQNEDIDVIAGGPPCQAFSTAGARRGFEDVRGNVFLHYIALIAELMPKYAVIENVRGLLSMPVSESQAKHLFQETGLDFSGRHGAIRLVAHQLKQAGYSVKFELYNSANFGVPQVRERVVVIASRDGEGVNYLKPTHAQNGDHGLASWVPLKDVISDLNNEDAKFIPFPEKRLKYYRLLGPGQNWRNLPLELQREALGGSFDLGGGKTGFYRRLSWDKPAATLLTHPAMPATDLGHPEENRPLSVQEYKRIQQYPDDWVIEGSIQQQYKQIGNSVPIGLGKAIGDAITSHSLNESYKIPEGFMHSRYRQTSDIDILGNELISLF